MLQSCSIHATFQCKLRGLLSGCLGACQPSAQPYAVRDDRPKPKTRANRMDSELDGGPENGNSADVLHYQGSNMVIASLATHHRVPALRIAPKNEDRMRVNRSSSKLITDKTTSFADGFLSVFAGFSSFFSGADSRAEVEQKFDAAGNA